MKVKLGDRYLSFVIYQAFWGETSSLDPENATTKDDEPLRGGVDNEHALVQVAPPDGEAEEDSGDGEEEAKEGAKHSAPVNLHPAEF